jgi:hypothetical protein
MPGIAINTAVYTDKYRYQAAARDCDELAGKLEEQVGKIRQLRGQITTAWRGDGGTSLDGAVGDEAWYLQTAANLLRSAAGQLRTAKEAQDN